MSTFGKILIVDDERGIGDVLVSWMEERGYTCVLARTVADSEYLQRKAQFDIILHVSEILFPPPLRKVIEARSRARLAN